MVVKLTDRGILDIGLSTFFLELGPGLLDLV